jgi:hypothetical protein
MDYNERDLEREQLILEFPGWCVYVTGIREGEFLPHARRNGPLDSLAALPLVVQGEDWTDLRDQIIRAESSVQEALHRQRSGSGILP